MRSLLVRETVFLLALAAWPARAASPDLAGDFDSPLGRVRLAREGEAVKGTLAEASTLCRFASGSEVLRGTVVDDSLAGQIRVCLRGAGCPAEEWAIALLLIGDGSLSGAVHVKGKGCRAPFGKKGGVRFRRVVASGAPVPPPTGAPAAGGREEALALLRDGALWLGEGNFEKARGRFEKAIAVDGTIPEAYNGVGVTFRMRNDLEKALEWYKRALSVDPDFGDAYYNIACVYALQGERTLALRYLQIAAMNGYATAEGIDSDPDLSSLRATREYRALRDRM